MFDLFKKKKPAAVPEPQPIQARPDPQTPAAPPVDNAPTDTLNPTETVAFAPPETTVDAEAAKSWTERLKQGLARTRNQLGGQLGGLFRGGKIDEDVYDELETALLTADIGVAATQALLDQIRSRVKRQHLSDTSQLRAALKDALLQAVAEQGDSLHFLS